MGKKEEVSVSDIKKLEDNQLDNIEDNQREQVFSEKALTLGMKCIFNYLRRHLIELLTEIKNS